MNLKALGQSLMDGIGQHTMDADFDSIKESSIHVQSKVEKLSSVEKFDSFKALDQSFMVWN